MEIKRVGSKELEFIEDTYVDAENVRSARFRSHYSVLHIVLQTRFL